jgi:predicted phosphodiesterase
MRKCVTWLPLVAILLFQAPVLGNEPAGKEEPVFTFAVSSDPHVAENRAGEPTGKEKFKTLLRQVEQQSPKPDFLLICGDLHVTAFQEVLAEAKPTIPLHVVPGNHERREDRDALRTLFPNDFHDADFYSFTHKGSLFIGLCDVGNGDHIGHFNSEAIRGPEQCEWLRGQLAEHAKAADRVFLFGHIPPHPEGTIAGGMFLSVNDQRFLRELVLEYPPTAMFFGHLHRPLEFQIGATPVIVLRSSNWNMSHEPLGFLKVNVFPKRIATEWIPLELK